MNDTVILLRTHYLSELLVAHAERIALDTGYPLYLLCDESRGPVHAPAGMGKIIVSPEIYRDAGLFAPDDVMWRCGDYVYYAAQQALPEVQRFWMIEHDVRFQMVSAADFFCAIDDRSDHDFLAAMLSPADDAWMWTPYMRQFVDDVYCCQFPVTRMTRRAVTTLLEERQRHSKQFQAIIDEEPSQRNILWRRWPNDESFVASVILQRGLTQANLNHTGRTVIGPGWYKAPLGPHSARWLNQQGPDGWVYHTVLEGAALLNRIKRRVELLVARGLDFDGVHNQLGQHALDGLAFECGADALADLDAYIFSKIKSKPHNHY